jgi:superfamily I DNA/RNA helicase
LANGSVLSIFVEFVMGCDFPGDDREDDSIIKIIMVDLLEGRIRSAEDRGNADLMGEAARLFYVGMTRAKKHLERIASL